MSINYPHLLNLYSLYVSCNKQGDITFYSISPRVEFVHAKNVNNICNKNKFENNDIRCIAYSDTSKDDRT